MKYRLINIQSKEEHFCDKVTINGFDYYVSDDKIKEDSWYIAWETINGIESNHIIQKATNVEPVDIYSWASNYKKLIATNNPNIDIPKIVNDEKWLNVAIMEEATEIESNRNYQPTSWYNGVKLGYNKSQETHPFSEEDMIGFYDWCDTSEVAANFWRRNRIYPTMDNSHLVKLKDKRKELFQIWKEQQPKIVYYND